MCVCVCVCVYVYIYIYTHTHILHNIEVLVGQKKRKKEWDSSECHMPRKSFHIP